MTTTALPLARPAALGLDEGRLRRIDRHLSERYVEMTQLMPSSTYPVRRELRTMVNGAIVELAG